MPRESQYLRPYLEENGRRGFGRGLTPGSYLAYRLRGQARDYLGKYRSALLRGIDAKILAGEACRAVSRLGGAAYYPLQAETSETHHAHAGHP